MKILLVSLMAFAELSSVNIAAQLPGQFQRVLYHFGSEEGDVTLRPHGVLEWRVPDRETVEETKAPQRVEIFMGNGSVVRFSGELSEDNLSRIMKIAAGAPC